VDFLSGIFQFWDNANDGKMVGETLQFAKFFYLCAINTKDK
jgi:hypothetical protein